MATPKEIKPARQLHFVKQDKVLIEYDGDWNEIPFRATIYDVDVPDFWRTKNHSIVVRKDTGEKKYAIDGDFVKNPRKFHKMIEDYFGI